MTFNIIKRTNRPIYNYNIITVYFCSTDRPPKEENIYTHSSNTVYFVELTSGEEYEYPAIFLLQFDNEDKAEYITCEIPPQVFDRLPDKAPIKIRFLLD